MGDIQRLSGAMDPRQQQTELVAAEASDRVDISENGADTRPDRHEQLVTERCPKVSLTSLKRSRSITSTATSPPWRRLAVSACFTLSNNRLRLGRLVNASVTAACSSRR